MERITNQSKHGWLVGLDTGLLRPIQIVETFPTRKAAETFARETRMEHVTIFSANKYHERAKAYLRFVRLGMVESH